MPAGSEMTAVDLSNKIIKMRKIILLSKQSLRQKLGRSIKRLNGARGDVKQKEQNRQKGGRLAEDIKALKMLSPDDVSKFSLINTKLLAPLIHSAKGDALKRALYRLATHKFVEETVAEFRQQFPNWHQEVPFYLQRLGHQYRNKKDKQKLAAEVHNILRQNGEVEVVGEASGERKHALAAGVPDLLLSEKSERDRVDSNNSGIGSNVESTSHIDFGSDLEPVETSDFNENEDAIPNGNIKKVTAQKPQRSPSSAIKNLLHNEIQKVGKKTKSMLKKKTKNKQKSIEKQLPFEPSSGYLEKRIVPLTSTAASVRCHRGEALIRKIDLTANRSEELDDLKVDDEQSDIVAVAPQEFVKRRGDAFFLDTTRTSSDADSEDDKRTVEETTESNIDTVIKFGERIMEKAPFKLGKGKKMKNKFVRSLKATAAARDVNAGKRMHAVDVVERGSVLEACSGGVKSKMKVKQLRTSSAKEQNETRKPKLCKNSEEEQLHPSWLAKRKEKQKSLSFQGKKIKFV